MMYAKGQELDEKLHKKFHAAYLSGPVLQVYISLAWCNLTAATAEQVKHLVLVGSAERDAHHVHTWHFSFRKWKQWLRASKTACKYSCCNRLAEFKKHPGLWQWNVHLLMKQSIRMAIHQAGQSLKLICYLLHLDSWDPREFVAPNSRGVCRAGPANMKSSSLAAIARYFAFLRKQMAGKGRRYRLKLASITTAISYNLARELANVHLYEKSRSCCPLESSKKHYGKVVFSKFLIRLLQATGKTWTVQGSTF